MSSGFRTAMVFLFCVVGPWGCAQTVVQSEQEALGRVHPRPGRVLVCDFAVTPAEVTANQSIIAQEIDVARNVNQTEQALQIGHDAARTLAKALVEGLRGIGLNAEHANQGTPVYDSDLQIVGHFIDVNEGNRLQRVVVGFGMGASTLDTEVWALQTTHRGREQLLRFTTHADSGELPGAAATMGVGAAAQGGVTVGMAAANTAASGFRVYRSQIEQLADRSAAKATAFISEYAGREGWIAPQQVQGG